MLARISLGELRLPLPQESTEDAETGVLRLLDFLQGFASIRLSLTVISVLAAKFTSSSRSRNEGPRFQVRRFDLFFLWYPGVNGRVLSVLVRDSKRGALSRGIHICASPRRHAPAVDQSRKAGRSTSVLPVLKVSRGGSATG